MATYISSDWHGKYDLWEQVKAFLQPEDKLIYLGDAVDRGSRGWDLLIELLTDDRVTFIKGNHEDLFETYMILKGKKKKQAYQDWINNGGDETIENIYQNGLTLESELVQSVVEVLKYLPIEATYTNSAGQVFHCTHAGFTPGVKRDNLDYGNRYWDTIWDRKHITDNWPLAHDNTYIIHGHTPCVNFKMFGLETEGYGPITYCQDHKINLDMATPFSNQLCLFNPDTFQVYVFTSKGEKYNGF